MEGLKFDFVEGPKKMAGSSDILLPHLSSLSKEKLNRLKGDFKDCDAVCTPPGYDQCSCKEAMPA